MGEYSDAWREFRAIIATTEKKLLKKPNLPQAIQQLNALSLRLQLVFLYFKVFSLEMKIFHSMQQFVT